MSNQEPGVIDANFEDTGVLIHSFVTKQIAQNEVMPTSNKLPDDDFAREGLRGKLLPPPFDPFKLGIIAENSSILGQCIDVMEVNIESFGIELVPSMDDKTFQKIKKEQEDALGPREPDKGTPTDKPNAAETEIEQEFRRLTNFFKFINRKQSYTSIRRRTRNDYELTGNAYWEILRNHVTSKITGVEWVPSAMMRIGRMDKNFTDMKIKRKTSDTEIEIIPDKMKFRRYAQIKEIGTKPIWFKEFGDPRIMDAETGGMAVVERNDKGEVTTIKAIADKEFDEFDVLKFKGGRMKVATEVLHFPQVNNSRTLPYGSPRWIGTLISILGSRSAEEVNLLYFDNKTVPPGMLLISGGKITTNTVDRVTDHIKNHVKGTKNFHSILVVEAENKPHPNMPAPTVPKLQWVKMTDAQHGDALFQGYDENNSNKVISTFRFWPGFVGKTKDVNRATADAARKLSEEQVFEPERMEFDSIINRVILPEMDINYWEHKSKGPQLSTPEDLANLAEKMKGGLTLKEFRVIAGKVFNIDFKEIDTIWTNLPLPVLTAFAAQPGLLFELLSPEDLRRIEETRSEELKGFE
ncbi:MAG: hypothetical protein O6939_03530, partial [Bacteroidetes bacterium]|nr:hypothetical protein [Bacteroidota bacterium]